MYQKFRINSVPRSRREDIISPLRNKHMYIKQKAHELLKISEQGMYRKVNLTAGFSNRTNSVGESNLNTRIVTPAIIRLKYNDMFSSRDSIKKYTRKITKREKSIGV
mmetsp:Transcript_16331/g.14252  ORF Transcript_16331/g.14252 Transcript_16331/m.14252 type:complete len:107 (+) Transcript_16331:141-461(+)